MKKLIALILLGLSVNAMSQEDYRTEYQRVMSQECSAKENGSKDERALSWGCTKETTELLLEFCNKLEARLDEVMSDTPKKHASYINYKKAWNNYYAATKEFDLEFHNPGSGGTALRLKSEQNAVRQRAEILISYLMDFYAL